MPKLTVGMPCYKEYDNVWFTLQALRLYQDLTDTEILVIDNFGDDRLKSFQQQWFHEMRYIPRLDCNGPAAAKDAVFQEARGDSVICMDSHCLLAPNTLQRFRGWMDLHPNCQDLLAGPLVFDDLTKTIDSLNDIWNGQFWGTWHETPGPVPLAAEYEIRMHGCGLLASKRSAWLGFNPRFRGFCGEEGYIHEKYRQAGHATKLLGFLRWTHLFRDTKVPTPYKMNFDDRVWNYVVGFTELGLDLTPVIKEFGSQAVTKAQESL